MELLSENAETEKFEPQSDLSFRSQHGLTKLFIDVPQFCKITGFARSTIYQYIREERFFMPCTVVQRTPYIKTEDFLDWYKNGCRTQDQGSR